MKKIIVITLAVAMVLSLGMLNVFAADPPTTSGEVHGIITNDPDVVGHFTGYVDGDYYLEIDGQFTSGFVDQHATFMGTVSGDFSGTITNGLYNRNGLDTMYAEITETGATETVRIQGVFLKSGIAGDFAGEIIVGDSPSAVTSLSITSPSYTMKAGTTMQMTAVTVPSGPYDVTWSVWMGSSDDPAPYDYAWIDQNGILHAYKPCTITVVANTLDPSLASKTSNSITIVDPYTEVTAGIDPTYTIIIPPSVDFGTLIKDSGIVTKDFNVEAQGVLIETNAHVDVAVAGSFIMKDLNGAGSVELAYSLSNETSAISSDGGTFATFTANTPADGTENGSISVNTAYITAAGSYKGTMVFTIDYNN